MYIREDVYENANNGQGRDRFTIAHELGHLILQHNHILARTSSLMTHKPYEDSEWQADNFAAEFLMPYGFVKNCHNFVKTDDALMEISYIAETCKVSFDAASIRYQIVHGKKPSQ